MDSLELIRTDAEALARRIESLEVAMDSYEKIRSDATALGVRVSALESARKTVLSQSDFTYLGTFNFATSGDAVYGKGMTHRYVNGQLEIVCTNIWPGNAEIQRPATFRLPAAFGQNMIPITTHYQINNFWGGGWGVVDPQQSLWWDEQTDLTWTASTLDYPQGGFSPNCTAVLAARRLPTGAGSCTNWTGWRGFQCIGARAAFGRVQRVPAWFRSKHNLPEFVSLSGGYTSLMAQGLTPSMGPMFFFFPSPWGYPAATPGGTNHSVPASDIRIAASFRSGVNARDWYSGNPDSMPFEGRNRDRAARVTPVANYLDFGSDPRGVENPNFAPTQPPRSTGNWLSPCPRDPNGYGRWTWGDSFHGTGNWIDGSRKHGVIAIATVSRGRAYYMSSAVHHEARAAELHVYNPEDLVANRPVSHLRPASLFALNEIQQYFGNGDRIDASYDHRTNRLHLMHYFGKSAKNYLHVYGVAA